MRRPSPITPLLALLALATTPCCRREPQAPHAAAARHEPEPKPAAPAAGPASAILPGEIASPALPDAGAPELSNSPAGLVFGSWLEPSASGFALRMAVVQAGEWSPPRTVTEGALVPNWADRPSVIAWGDGAIAAHWLALDPRKEHAQSVRFATSTNGGRDWSETFVPHRDEAPAEHGFASLVDLGDAVGIAWLDGRRMTGSHGGDHGTGGDMELRWATLRDSALTKEIVLDPRACECCPTAAARFGEDVVVAYRDRSADEVRDIAVVRLHDGGWTPPAIAHADGWKVEGCPVNGPALAASLNALALAWFTAADEKPRVQVALSPDGGATFGEPIRVDEGAPIGRVDVAALHDGSFAVGWIESAGDAATFRVRRISRDGKPGPALIVTAISPGRYSGHPRLARQGELLLAAWLDTSGAVPALRTARLPFPA